MRSINMKMIQLLCDCGDGVIGLIQHHIRMFTMTTHVEMVDMEHIARVLNSCGKLHRVLFTNCNFGHRQIDVWLNNMGDKKVCTLTEYDYYKVLF